MNEPMTPADCDLRAFATMPLDAVRLFGSEFHAVASDAAWRAGVTLWLRAWHQVPAASLPDDDVQLARLAELGRDVKAWRKIRAQALHGWIKCSDGRLYHPVVAEKAMDAWEKREEFAEKRANKADRQRRWRDRLKDVSSRLRDLGIVPPTNASLETLERLLGDAEKTDGRRLHPSTGDGLERERERDSTEANASGEPSSPPSDPDKIFWDNAKAYLGKAKAPMIGRWVSSYGKDKVAGAIAQAQVERAVDPVPYVEAILRRSKLSVVNGGEWQSPC